SILRGSVKRRSSQPAAARRNGSLPLVVGYFPKLLSDFCTISPTNGGIGCCGSPTVRLIGGLPGSCPGSSSVSRMNGERVARADEGSSRLAATDMRADYQ